MTIRSRLLLTTQPLRLPRLVHRDEQYATVVYPTGTVGADRFDAALARSMARTLQRDGIVAVQDDRIIPREEFYRPAEEDE